MKIQNLLTIIAGMTFCAVAPLTHAQCPQTCDSYDNTALGTSAGLGTGQNVAVGALALQANGGFDTVAIGFAAMANSTGPWDTAVGAGALQFNNGSLNTAVGFEALYGIAGSSNGVNNTAVGVHSLYSDTTGNNNTASGYSALFNDTTGNDNTADGYQALFFNTTGTKNTASGRGALYNNTSASNNTATGYQALNKNKTGTGNVATGYQALNKDTASYSTATSSSALAANTVGTANVGEGYDAMFTNTTGSNNTAIGYDALYFNLTGGGNIALGADAGFNITGNFNIDIGNEGLAGESSVTRIGSTQTSAYIAGIYGATASSGVAVYVDANGHLGTATSSARFKENIEPMDKASEAILSLQPVTFRYKKELDPKAIPQFGLVAEQVAKVDRDLVAKDKDGKPYTVRYEAVNAMLLNEFLKAHHKIEQQEAMIAQQQSTNRVEQREIEELKTQLKTQAAKIQEVSEQLDSQKTMSRLAINDE